MQPSTTVSSDLIVIINKKARQSNDVAETVLAACRSRLSGITEVFLAQPDEITQALHEARARKPHTVVIGGGDGTIRTAAATFAGTSTRLGILPLGTTNNFARSLRLPLDWTAALAVIAAGHTSTITLGKANDAVFCSGLTLGISVDTARQTTRAEKRRIGRLAYIKNTARLFWHHQPFRCDLTIDGETTSFTTHQILIANAPYHAAVPIAPESVEEPHLTALVFGKNDKRWSHIKNGVRYLLGHYQDSRDGLVHTGRRIEIRTDKRLPIEADGEVIGTTPVVCTAWPAALHVYLPTPTPSLRRGS